MHCTLCKSELCPLAQVEWRAFLFRNFPSHFITSHQYFLFLIIKAKHTYQGNFVKYKISLLAIFCRQVVATQVFIILLTQFVCLKFFKSWKRKKHFQEMEIILCATTSFLFFLFVLFNIFKIKVKDFLSLLQIHPPEISSIYNFMHFSWVSLYVHTAF